MDGGSNKCRSKSIDFPNRFFSKKALSPHNIVAWRPFSHAARTETGLREARARSPPPRRAEASNEVVERLFQAELGASCLATPARSSPLPVPCRTPRLPEMWISKTGATAKRGSAAVPSRASTDTVKARITDKELDDIVAVLSQVSLADSPCRGRPPPLLPGKGARFRRVARETQERARIVHGWVGVRSS